MHDLTIMCCRTEAPGGGGVLSGLSYDYYNYYYDYDTPTPPPPPESREVAGKSVRRL